MATPQRTHPVTVRAYRTDDLDAIIEVFLRAIRETASADYDPNQIAAWAQVDRDVWLTRRGSRPTWVAEVMCHVVGFTDLEDDGHMDMMYVHPEAVGRGVGRALVSAAELHALSRGLTRIYSEVSLTARSFFERNGFQVVEPERVIRNGQWFDRFKMEKRLATNAGSVGAMLP